MLLLRGLVMVGVLVVVEARRSGAEVLESRRRMLSLMDPRREGSRSSEGRSLNRAWVKGSRESWRRTNNGNRQKAFSNLPRVKDKPFKFDLLGDFAAFDSKLSVVPALTTMPTLVDTTQKPTLATLETTPEEIADPEIENHTTMKLEETSTTESEGLFFTFCCGVNSRTCLKASQVCDATIDCPAGEDEESCGDEGRDVEEEADNDTLNENIKAVEEKEDEVDLQGESDATNDKVEETNEESNEEEDNLLEEELEIEPAGLLSIHTQVAQSAQDRPRSLGRRVVINGRAAEVRRRKRVRKVKVQEKVKPQEAIETEEKEATDASTTENSITENRGDGGRVVEVNGRRVRVNKRRRQHGSFTFSSKPPSTSSSIRNPSASEVYSVEELRQFLGQRKEGRRAQADPPSHVFASQEGLPRNSVGFHESELKELPKSLDENRAEAQELPRLTDLPLFQPLYSQSSTLQSSQFKSSQIIESPATPTNHYQAGQRWESLDLIGDFASFDAKFGVVIPPSPPSGGGRRPQGRRQVAGRQGGLWSPGLQAQGGEGAYSYTTTV